MPHKPRPKSKKSNSAPKSKTKQVTQVTTTHNAPVSKSVRKVTTRPKMQNSANGVVIEHTEYCMDVTSTSSNFQAYKIPINPGIVLAFPWLSSVAARFESYLFERLEFMYKPLCSTTTPGVVILAVDYDATDPTPNSKVVANSYAESSSSSVWDMSHHYCKGSNLRKFGIQRYVRSSEILGTDPRVSDVGNLFVCTSNTPTTATQLGEVWVSYKLKLFTPQITSMSSAFAPGQPQVPSGYAQSMKLVTTPNSIAWTGEYYNNCIAAIQKYWVEPDSDIKFDVVFNPAAMGKRFLMFLATNGGTFGVPPGLVDGFNSALQVFRGIGNWAINSYADTTDRIFLMDFASNDNASTTIPTLRFNYANNVTREPQFTMLEYDGPYPDSPPYSLNTIDGAQGPPIQNLINWGSFLSSAVDGVGVIDQRSDVDGNLHTMINGRLSQTLLCDNDMMRILDAISLDG